MGPIAACHSGLPRTRNDKDFGAIGAVPMIGGSLARLMEGYVDTIRRHIGC